MPGPRYVLGQGPHRADPSGGTAPAPRICSNRSNGRGEPMLINAALCMNVREQLIATIRLRLRGRKLRFVQSEDC